MDTPARGKTLRDYSPTSPAPPQFSLPREPGSGDRFSSRQKTPGVGEVRGTSRSMGPKAIGGGETFSHPFKISVRDDEGVPKYTVAKGSITNGTNGAAISLAGITETETTAAAGYVVIEADVDEDMVITGWALSIKTAATDANEVGMTTSGVIRQNKIRLLIGKLTMDGAVATAWQAQFSSVRISVGLLDGVAVKVFDAAPTYPTSI